MAPDGHFAIAGSPPCGPVPRDVGLALAYMRRALTQPITAPELARLCGVPQRTLQRHFAEFLGHAPLEHFRRMRLAAVREALLAPVEHDASVIGVATRFGFTHPGRFAGEYRRRFGETPSATLARGRAAARNSADGAMLSASHQRHAPAIAVLRFHVDGVGFVLQGFADSLAEHLAGALARTHAFTVHLVRPAPGERAARATGARYCLAVRVVRLPSGAVRVVTRLSDLTAGERQLWGDAHDGTVEDLPALQDRVVDEVVGAVRPSIEAAEVECARQKPAGNLAARDLVLRAMPFVLAADPASARQALGMLEEAMGLDPDDPRPVALAAWCRTQFLLYAATDDPIAEQMRAEQLAGRAAALDPLGDAAVLTARSGVAIVGWRCDETESLVARARTIDPGSSWPWERSGWNQLAHAAPSAAIDCFRRALRLRGPQAPIANCLAGIGMAHYCAGRLDEAALLHRRALAANPAAAWLNQWLAVICLELGERQAAATALDTLRRARPELTIGRLVSVIPGLREGRRGPRSDRMLDGLATLGLPA
jgi:adenylate cyclase